MPHGLRPLTVDQVRMLMRPNVVGEAAIKEGRTLQGLGIDRPHATASIVPEYLERFRPHGQFANYRS
jgi:NADH dehydrogenase